MHQSVCACTASVGISGIIKGPWTLIPDEDFNVQLHLTFCGFEGGLDQDPKGRFLLLLLEPSHENNNVRLDDADK